MKRGAAAAKGVFTVGTIVLYHGPLPLLQLVQHPDHPGGRSCDGEEMDGRFAPQKTGGKPLWRLSSY